MHLTTLTRWTLVAIIVQGVATTVEQSKGQLEIRPHLKTVSATVTATPLVRETTDVAAITSTRPDFSFTSFPPVILTPIPKPSGVRRADVEYSVPQTISQQKTAGPTQALIWRCACRTESPKSEALPTSRNGGPTNTNGTLVSSDSLFPTSSPLATWTETGSSTSTFDPSSLSPDQASPSGESSTTVSGQAGPEPAVFEQIGVIPFHTARFVFPEAPGYHHTSRLWTPTQNVDSGIETKIVPTAITTTRNSSSETILFSATRSLETRTVTSSSTLLSQSWNGDTSYASLSTNTGNMTFNFDDIPAGQLFNPYRSFWFSEGFIAQAASESPYESVAGEQLAEFIPAPLSNGGFNSTHDLAMISIGPQCSNPCFQFSLYSLSLGCASNRTFQDCHFWIWGLRYNSTTGREENVVASQDVQTLACTQPRCGLTTKEFCGSYKNLTSIIIQIRSGGKPRLWWADNLVMGWADNSCAATKCRERGALALEGSRAGQE